MYFEEIDHTADLGIRVYGKDLKELLENSARALMETLTDIDTVEPKDEVAIEAEGETPEELLIHWLEEVLYLHFVKKYLFRNFKIESLGKKKLGAVARGELIDPKRHEVNFDIKAVTYHDLNIERVDDKLKVDIIFDI